MAELEVGEDEIAAALCRGSFYDFCLEFMSEAVADPIEWNWHIRVVCDELQASFEAHLRGDPARSLVINQPPGTTKSLICSVLFPAWTWTRRLSTRVICASFTHALALSFSRKTRNVVTSAKWSRLFGKVQLRDDQNTKQKFENVDGGFRFAASVEGGVLGEHAHVIVMDDPMDPKGVASEAQRTSILTWIVEQLLQRKVSQETTLEVTVMQRLGEVDPTSLMLDRGARHVCLPAELEPDADVVRPRRLARFYTDGLLFPSRLSRATLEKMKGPHGLGEFGYAAQMLQRPGPRAGGMFKVDRVAVERAAPSLVRRVRSWDKAGTSGGTGAMTAGVLMGVDAAKHYWILDVIRGRWESAERERVIRQTAEADGTDVEVVIEQEPGSGGKESAENTIRNLAGWRVRVVRPTGDKVLRADPLSVQVNGSNVSAVQADWLAAFLNELRHFPNPGSLRDQVDAASQGFSILARGYVGIMDIG